MKAPSHARVNSKEIARKSRLEHFPFAPLSTLSKRSIRDFPLPFA